MSSQPTSPRSVPPLSDEDRTQLEAIVAHGAPAWRHRAAIILAAARPDSPGPATIAASVGVSTDTVQRWLNRFRSDGMAVFAAALTDVSGLVSGSEPPGEEAEVDDRMAVGAPSKEPIPLVELCARYSVDMVHASHVIRLARRLFDNTRSIHQLPAEACRLLEAAAMVHNLAYTIDAEQQHLVGRDILLAQPLSDFSNAERRMLACMTVFHRGKVRAADEPTFQALKPTRRQETLALTALLRIADALDYSHSQTCTLVEAVTLADGLHLVVEGSHADLNGVRAVKMADVWQEVFQMPVTVREAFPPDVVQRDTAWARLAPELPMAEAARRLFKHYLVLVEQHADHVREHDDEWLVYLERDLARLQGVYRLFGDAFDVVALAGSKKDVRWLYRQVNNAVITRAVVVATRVNVLAESTSSSDGELAAVFKTHEAAANKAIRKLRKTLGGGRYRRFVAHMLEFTGQTGAGVFPGERSLAPVSTQAALLVWQEFARLRSKGPGEGNSQTQWRSIRRFHNAVHCLGHLLGPSVQDVLSVVQPLEAQLRDVMLGEAVLAALPPAASTERAQSDPDLATIEALLHSQQDWLADTRRQVAVSWEAIQSVSFRQALAVAVAYP